MPWSLLDTGRQHQQKSNKQPLLHQTANQSLKNDQSAWVKWAASLIAHYWVSHVCLFAVNIPLAGRVWETEPQTKRSRPRRDSKQRGKGQFKEFDLFIPSLPSNSPVWKAPSVHLGSTFDCWKVSRLLLYCFVICVGKKNVFVASFLNWNHTHKKNTVFVQ